MNKDRRKERNDYREEDDGNFYEHYVRSKEHKKEKRIRTALKTRDIKSLMDLEEEYE